MEGMKKREDIGSMTLTRTDILEGIRTVSRTHYHEDRIDILERVLDDVGDLFSGRRKGYLKCDTWYHNLMHTLQVLPPFLGIIEGRNKSKDIPGVSKELFVLGIIAVLLHDTGYIKAEGDNEGTGGKYTFVHIQRSIDYSGKYLLELGVDENSISTIRNFIMCTGVFISSDTLPFRSEEEKLVGYALGTADLLGQMSSAAYPEKLHLLYREFEEAYHYEGMENLRRKGVRIFASADELIRNTPDFFATEVMKRFEKMGSLHRYLTYHFEDSGNHYIEAIEENMKKIQRSCSL